MPIDNIPAARLEAVLRRAQALNPRWRAFSFIDAAGARAASAESARREAEGRTLGPLDGMIVTLKGNIPVAGWPWTEGSALYRDRRATADAGIVAKLRAAGAVLLGATTLSELAMYSPDNPAEPMGLNPWDPLRTAGGSTTGGGVAAALGLGDLHLGTDSGGSVRNPAIHCGVVGFKPRLADLSTSGMPIYARSLDVLGLLARDLGVVEAAMAVLGTAGDGTPPGTATPPRLLVPRALIEATADEETQALFAAACTRLRATGIALIEAELPGWTEAEQGAGATSLHEGGRVLQDLDLARLGPRLRARAAAWKVQSPEAVATARQDAERFAASFGAALRAHGATGALTPGWPFPAPWVETETVVVRGQTIPLDPRRNAFARLANAIDAPAIALPAGIYPSAGVPFALQITGAPGAPAAPFLQATRAVATALPPPPAPAAATTIV